MSDNKYIVVAGVVSFDPKFFDTKVGEIMKFQVQTVGGQSRLQFTIFPNSRNAEVDKIKQGDLVMGYGQYKTSQGQNQQGDAVTYHDLVVNSLAVFPNILTPRDQQGSGAPSKPSTSNDPGF